MVVATVAISVLFISIGIEFIHRELHLTKDGAGIVIIAGFAVVFGQAETASRENDLHTAFHTDDRENTDGNVYVINAYAVNKATVKTGTNLFGNCVYAHTAVTEGTATFNKLAVETDGRCNLNDNGGKCGFAIATKVVLIEAEAVFLGVGSEDRNVLFRAEENDFFIKCAKTFNFLYSAAAYACFESYTEIITNGYLIKSFIEGYGFDINAGIDNLYAFASYCACFVDYFLSHIAEMNTNVLETVFISCRIENLVYADAAKLFFIAAKSAERAVFFHYYIPP